MCEKRGFSEVHKIVWGISFEDLDTNIQACPEAVNGLDIYGYMPLDYAVQFGNSDHVRVLLSHGADIGRRPHRLFWTAVESGNCASTQLLLDQGLRPNDLVPRPSKFDPYSPADKLNGYTQSKLRSFGSYIDPYEHCTPAMDRLLIDYGFDFNTRFTDGLTTLMACCRGDISPNRINRMKFLLEHGIAPEITDSYGQTAIHHALHNDNLRAFELLTEYGARLNARTSNGENVLHMAAERTSVVAMVHALSKAGIMQLDLDARRYGGETAFDVLRRRAAETEGFYWKFPPRTTEHGSHIEVHVQIIRAFESLFQEIQEHQGVPLEDRYPPLPIAVLGELTAAESAEDTYSFSSEHAIYESDEDSYPTWSDDASYGTSDEDDIPANPDSTEPICAPPGAWPE